MRNKTGFTLLELSIVIIIVGILIAGVLSSSSIIRSSKLAGAQAITRKSPVPNIEGLLFWYETTSPDSFTRSETVDGGNLNSWYDISPDSLPNKYNTATHSNGAYPTYKINGINDLPSVQFAGTSYFYTETDYKGQYRYATTFVVFRPSSISGDTVLCAAGNSSAGRAIAFTTSGIGQRSGIGGNIVASTTTLVANMNYIAAANHNDTSSQIFLNNPTTKVGGNLNVPAYDSKGVTIGAGSDSLLKYSGLISEVIVYNRVLSSQERNDIMRYLAKKYNITINP